MDLTQPQDKEETLYNERGEMNHEVNTEFWVLITHPRDDAQWGSRDLCLQLQRRVKSEDMDTGIIWEQWMRDQERS